MRKVKLNKRDVVALVVLAAFVISAFVYLVYRSVLSYRFANQMENLYAKNESSVFSIDKIVMYSSANAIDNSEGQTMQDLNICQFTDMAIYLDNMADINGLIKESDAMNVSLDTTNDEASNKIKEHTIKELYIDNIKINPASNKGEKTLSYKNPTNFGKFVASDVEQPERIEFEVVSTNEDNDKSDYTKPIFYADCSNPITLSYMNKNIIMGYAVGAQDTQITFDGKILQSVGVSLADLNCTIDFDIHIKNNLDQEFTCGVGVEIPLSSENRSIYNGYMYGMQNELQNKFRFFKK